MVQRHVSWIRGTLGVAVLVLGCQPWWPEPFEPTAFQIPRAIIKPGLQYVAHRDTVQRFLSGLGAKLAYIEGSGKNRAIYFVDYTGDSAFPPPLRLHMPVEQDPSLSYSVETPMISPDGKWVAYFISDFSSTHITYVQSLDTASRPRRFAEGAAHPHWWKDRTTGKLYLLYCSAASGDVAAQSTPGYTNMQEVDSNNPATTVGLPDTLVHGFYNGGISRNGRYLFTGDYRSYVYDRTTSAVIPINPGTQTCNASTSPDTGNNPRFMFLNIGGAQTLANDNGPYEQHSIVFIVGRDNSAIRVLDKNVVFSPSRGEWDDPEWSNHPDYFVAVSQKEAANAYSDFDCYIVRIGPPTQVLQVNNDEHLKMAGDASPYLWIEGQ